MEKNLDDDFDSNWLSTLSKPDWIVLRNCRYRIHVCTEVVLLSRLNKNVV